MLSLNIFIFIAENWVIFAFTYLNYDDSSILGCVHSAQKSRFSYLLIIKPVLEEKEKEENGEKEEKENEEEEEEQKGKENQEQEQGEKVEVEKEKQEVEDEEEEEKVDVEEKNKTAIKNKKIENVDEEKFDYLKIITRRTRNKLSKFTKLIWKLRSQNITKHNKKIV